ncbi:hypothetical protein JCM5353_001186 [Sporobolomyces roseus]
MELTIDATLVCNDGFERNGVRCLDSVSPAANSTSIASTSTVAATTTTPAPSPTSTTLIVSSTTTSAQPSITLTPNALAAAGVTGFQGLNTNAILSWFKTNLATDSTNGNSWCGYPYTDAVPGFAPSVGTMLANFDWNYEAAAKAYCGLEAVVMTPDGRNMTMYLADGFDVKWLITPSSLDIVYGSFDKLFGRVTNNKNDVVKQGSWYFTGNRNERYKFKGLGARGL